MCTSTIVSFIIVVQFTDCLCYYEYQTHWTGQLPSYTAIYSSSSVKCRGGIFFTISVWKLNKFRSQAWFRERVVTRKCTSMAVYIIPYMLLCTFLNLVTILGYECYASINIVSHYPPPGKCQERGGDINYTKFKYTTYWACQSIKSLPSPHLKDGY